MNVNLLTVGEAAKRKGVSSTAIYSAIAEGRLNARQIVGRWAITENDLNKYEPTQYGSRAGAKRRGGRPKGSSLSQEHKARIAEAQATRWQKLKADTTT